MAEAPSKLVPINLAEFMRQDTPRAYNIKPAEIRYDPLAVLYSHLQTTPLTPKLTYSDNSREYKPNARLPYSDNNATNNVYGELKKQFISYKN